jgi:hypothetical protein
MGVRRSPGAVLAVLFAGGWVACGLPVNGEGTAPSENEEPDASMPPVPMDASRPPMRDASQPDAPSALDVSQLDVSTDVGPAVDAGPLAAWKKRIPLTIHNETHPQLNDFGALVVLNSTRIDYADLQETGQDLRFTDASGNLLPHEIELFALGGTSFVWVKVQAAANTTTTVWMYYDNPTAADAQDPVGLWKATYVGVWHMADEHDSTGQHTSTSNGYTAATGFLGDPAATFDGMAQNIDTGSTDALATFTLEAFVFSTNAPQATTHGYPINGDTNYQMLWNADFSFPTYVGSLTAEFGTNWPEVSFAPLSGSTWYYLACTYDGSNMRAYVDGQLSNTLAQTGTPAPDQGDAIIASTFPGTVSEVRISNERHSGDWLAAQNASLRDQGFVTYGAPQSL